MNRMLKVSLLLSTLALTACGFHLRDSVALPPSMQQVHLNVGDMTLRRNLDRALTASGITTVDHAGAGIAELKIPIARFSNEILTVSGFAQVTEYAIHYHVEFSVEDGSGQMLIPNQGIDMTREYSYDATDTVGTQGQIDEIEGGLSDDMVQAILFRLQAAAKHAAQTRHEVAPASAASSAP
jgi:LPS-assembly lipoprotein